ncbi:DUF3298 and DUF4163 domain-containing protein [Neolewinella litorea]|uniref:DUF3298 domain-containing protein n=1 Tax=Neolewinella litorea TaxID=2562452 RepID=A0A4S4NNT8_9BACT|nr:DUF3298 and DUF4163 domain-containing protein [Neolewinella litorea]THH40697.1 DUF3298 domain-containing protein [Neolewinella litorea]
MRTAAPLLLLLCCLFACENAETIPDDDPVTAVRPAVDPLKWEPYTLEDSAALRPRGPYYTYRLSTLRATDGDPTLRRMINDTLAAYVLGEPLAVGASLEEVLPSEQARRFSDYQQQELEEEWLQEAPSAFTMAEDHETEVVFQNDSLVVLAHHYYIYSGGAHGNFVTTLLPFATTPPRRLAFSDLFREGSEPHLRRLLTERGDSLTEGMLYVDSVPVTDNLAPLPDGVRFVYEPYAIAPYAAGEVVIELTYGEVEEWLRPGVAGLVE